MHNATISRKKLKIMIMATVMLLTVANNKTFAQDGPQHVNEHYQDFGNTLNLGVGFIYSNYINSSVPIFMINYEFNVARDFTLAPFIGIASYTSGDNYHYGNDYYYYRETIVPVGVEGTYYFNRLLDLNRKWDIYAAASLGYVYDKITWEDGYDGGYAVNDPNHLYLDLHVGAEYHINRRVGLYLDLSTGVSTVGIAIHHR